MPLRSISPLRALLLFGSVLWTIAGIGCATRGPNHIYVATSGGEPIGDIGPAGQLETPISSHTSSAERILGIAYDSFTDHLFIRIAPGDRVRVIERPSQRPLREMKLPGVTAVEASATNVGLAIRSRDRHLLVVDGSTILEFSLFGKLIQKFELDPNLARIDGLAFDQSLDRLLVLVGDDNPSVISFTTDGKEVSRCRLDSPIRRGALAFDNRQRRFLALLPEAGWVGSFSEKGQLIEKIEVPVGATSLAAGERSLIRVF